MVLWLTDPQARQIAHHAKEVAPGEACGLIAGVDNRAERIFPIPNSAADPRHRFEMDHSALVKTMFAINAEGLSLIGIYHSHPGGDPIPSVTDILQANYPDTAYLIVGLRDSKANLAAWRITPTRTVERVQLHIGDNAPDPPGEITLTRAQRVAIIVSALVALAFFILISLSLLPPAPPIPGPIH